MDLDRNREPRPAGIGLEHEPSLVGAEPHPSNANCGPNATSRSNREVYHRYDTDGPQHDATAQEHRQPLLHHGRQTIPDSWTRSTSYSGPLSLPKAHASGLNPTGAPPIGATKPSHRNPYQYWQSYPYLVSTGLQRSLSGDRLQRQGGDPPFSPPFLHPLSHRMNLSRSQSPLPASPRRSRDSQRPRAKFTIGSSRPNSPIEPEPKPRSTPPPSPFTIRGFLALSTFSKAVAVLFVCCFFVLARAFFGVGHNLEKCGACAHKVTGPGPRSGPVPGRFGTGMDKKDPRFDVEDRNMPDRSGRDEQVRVWIERFDEMYGDRYGWKAGEYEVVHDDDGDSDEYEHEDFAGPA